jgi:hypothetical protein
VFPKNSLSLDIDDFRLKGWMSIEITGCFLTGRTEQNFTPYIIWLDGKGITIWKSLRPEILSAFLFYRRL